MRVLFVINSLGAGGAERSLAEMLVPLSKAGVEPVVACFDRRQEGSAEEVLAAGFDVRFLAARRMPARIRELRKLIRALRPDVVHTTLFEADVAGRLAAVGTGVPVLTSLVNTTYDPVRRGDPNIRAAALGAYRVVDGWTARHLTAHLHAITQAVKDSAVATLGIPAERVTVIERGRDPGRLGTPGAPRRRSARLGLGLADDDEVLVNVARHEYQKGQATLLEAMAVLAPRRPRLVLLQAGRQGHASEDLHRLAGRLALGDRVRLLGHRTDVPELLAAADLFVFPSLYEGLGGAVVEAMALGLPVVASDLPALREVVEPGRNALLVPRESPEALADAISRLLDDDGRRRDFAARSRQIFEQRFTLGPSADRMVALYGEVAGRDPGKP